MYATISDLINDLFGIYIPLPIQTFGFFMGVAFMAAYWLTASELKRKEAAGLLFPLSKKIILNKRVTVQEYIIQVFFGALIGFKVIEAVFNYSDLLANTQTFLLSTRGNLLGAILGGVIAYFFQKQEDDKAKKQEPQEKIIIVHPYELMGNIILIGAIAGLLGAKIFHNLENLNDFAIDPIGALFSFSGLTYYGGLIVAAIAILRYTNKNGINWKHMIDATAPALIFAYGIGRIGCHLSGDGDWGIENLAPKPEWMAILPDWMWSMKYAHNVLSEGIPIIGCEGRHCFELPIPVYPTPFYEVLMSFVIFGILWSIRKRVQIPAMLFSIYLIFNGMERFLIEQIRVNTTYTIAGKHITQAEIISALFFIIGISYTVYLYVKHKNAIKI
jgi:phosphatidylglycerol:prolipoprotein diacylglycerol transferase